MWCVHVGVAANSQVGQDTQNLDFCQAWMRKCLVAVIWVCILWPLKVVRRETYRKAAMLGIPNFKTQVSCTLCVRRGHLLSS